MSRSLIFGFAIGLVLLALSLHGLNFAEITQTMAQGSWGWLCLAVPLYTMCFFFRSLRWSFLLAPRKKISPFRIFPIMMIGFFINLAGLRVGELARAYVIGRNMNFPKSTALATVLVERVFDVLALVLVFGVSIF